ncbi:MAG: FAD binding domain-containing protein [Planctomycetes bacterium]|nr:FAD binding domain-containing protein [Planctomycetota bacterium]
MILPELTCHRPATLAEALRLLGELGAEAAVVCGGTDVLVDMKERLRAPKHLVSIRRIAPLGEMALDPDGALRIGAAVTANAIAASALVRPEAPALAEAAGTLASYPVRNLATIGGNLISAVPSSDFAPILVALEAEAILEGREGRRAVPLDRFFLGVRRTVRQPHEILTAVRIPAGSLMSAEVRVGACYLKFAYRGASSLAVAGVAARIRLAPYPNSGCLGCRVVLGAVAPTPILVHPAAACRFGNRFNAECLGENARLALEQAQPIDDIRGSAKYRLEIVDALTRRAVETAGKRANRE